MKKILFPLMLFLCFACQKKPMDRAKVEKRLKSAMSNFLYKNINYDSSRIRYNVKDVNYYEDKTFFECEFKVELQDKLTNTDTVGIMQARISKDFSTVNRKS